MGQQQSLIYWNGLGFLGLFDVSFVLARLRTCLLSSRHDLENQSRRQREARHRCLIPTHPVPGFGLGGLRTRQNPATANLCFRPRLQSAVAEMFVVSRKSRPLEETQLLSSIGAR
jgi:hypothetical protein